MAKVVIALDKWTDTVKCLMSGVDVVKVHATALLNGELNTIANMIRKYLRNPPEIFLDLKIADISFGDNEGSNYKIAKAVADNYGDVVSQVNVHAFMKAPAIREVVAGGGDRVKALALCGMTDKVYQERFSAEDTAEMVGWAVQENAYGVILPGNDLQHINGMLMRGQTTMPIWSPGFGRQNKYGDIYSQLKVWRELVGSSPDNAAIIGTHLLEHPNIEEEVQKIRDIIK